jgi:hypothetical protein
MSIIGVLRTNVHSCFKGLKGSRSVVIYDTVAYPGILFGSGWGSTNSVEDTENGDLGALAP